jgi:lysophospholipase L1-like esterase
MPAFSFYDAHEPPFSLHGLVPEPGYARVPRTLLPALRPPVQRLALETAGGRVRFATDATTIVVRIRLSDRAIKTHMTPLNMAGAELYAGAGPRMRRVTPLRPRAIGEVPFEKLDGYTLDQTIEQTVNLSGERQTYTLYLPTFTGVESVEIGFPEGAEPSPAAPYALAKPIVFYGSSITQGACACRPSLSYPARVCARLDADYLNLGFAGNALGDIELARYIAGLNMSAFVLDYDHNAPTAEHLQRTHRAFFETVRQAWPELPILLVTRPETGRNPEETDANFAVIRATYESALRAGDRHVALLDGRDFYPPDAREDCLTDLIHPNDEGFSHIAAHVLPALRALLAPDEAGGRFPEESASRTLP